MKTFFASLLDILIPSRVEVVALRLENAELLCTCQQHVATMDKQAAEIRQILSLNARNAQVHRRDQVAAHYQNLRLQVAEARLAGHPVDDELSSAAEEGKNIQLREPLPFDKQPKPTSPNER